LRQELQRLLDEVARWAERFPCIERGYIFGSFVRGYDLRPESDIDIGIQLSDQLIGNDLLIQSYNELQAENASWRLGMNVHFGRWIQLHGINAGEVPGPAWRRCSKRVLIRIDASQLVAKSRLSKPSLSSNRDAPRRRDHLQ
jgi:predicted nucleotidyltransferase